MVFRNTPITEPQERERESSPSTPSSSSMATAPVKSKPLHNFSLPHLKWGKNQTSNHQTKRCRKPPNESSSRDSPSTTLTTDHHHHHHNNNRSSASEAESDDQETVGSKTVKNRVIKTEPRVVGGDEVRSNLVLRIPKGELKNNTSGGVGVVAGEADEGGLGKPWNLRPRKSIVKTNNNEASGGGKANGEVEEVKQEIHHHHHQQQQPQQPKSLRLRGLVESNENVEKKEKLVFSIPLTREEIEEDIFVITGSKPNRRPKKRNRTIQKQLDNVFPGMWLAGITADSYNVPEDLPKKL